MQIDVFADSHDHLDHVRKAVLVFNQRRCETVLFAGDLVSIFAIPPLCELGCPLVACFGDNEGNKLGLLAGIKIVGVLGEPPFGFVATDGTRFLLAHMERQLRGINGEFDMAVYAHSHKPKITRDAKKRLYIDPGETRGWTFNDPTIVILALSSTTHRCKPRSFIKKIKQKIFSWITCRDKNVYNLNA